MNRRDMFKGVAGGAAALSLQRPQSQAGPPAYPQPGYGEADAEVARTLLSEPPTADPLWEVKQALRRKACEERDRLVSLLDRRASDLADLKSVSPAYRRYRLTQLFTEQELVRQRFYQFCESL